MERWKKRAIGLIGGLVFDGRGELAITKYYPQKTEVGGIEKRFFARTTPERHGISSQRIYNMLCALEAEKKANVHNITVMADGEVISECSAPGYKDRGWQVSYSMSKTVVGMLIGSLVSDGILDVEERLVDVFPEIAFRDKRFSDITLRHLLTMSSGVDFAEAGAITESLWTEAFFGSTLRFAPGTRFSYNSMNSYILARVAERRAARPFSTLVEERIFAPLGIESYCWEKSPEGTEKGGWGLYLSSESWAKLGMTVLDRGVFLGRRIFSPEWFDAAFSAQATAPLSYGDFNYGYHVWVGRKTDEILFSGMFGQNIWICPKNRIVVIMSAGNNEIFQASPTLNIVRRFLGGEISDRLAHGMLAPLRKKEGLFWSCRRWIAPDVHDGGVFRFFNRLVHPDGHLWDRICASYVFAESNVGMMPLMLRLMQNNLRGHIEAVSILRRGRRLYFGFKQCENTVYIPVGLYDYESSQIDFRGEKYLIRAIGEAVRSVDGDGVEYRIEIIFCETASVRRIRITRNEDFSINMELYENPNDLLVENLLREYRKNKSVISFLADIIERRLGEDVLKEKIQRTFRPTLVGANRARGGCDRILERERALSEEKRSSTALIRGIVERFFVDSSAGGENENGSGKTEKASARKINAKKTKTRAK